MKFRLHRELYEDSMSEIRIFNNKKGLEDYLNKIYNPYLKVEDIKFKYAYYDPRNDWETYYVLVKFFEEENYIVSGMSDANLE